MRYEVIDNQTGAIMGNFTTRRDARRCADMLDLQYGAIRYYVRIVK